MIKRQAMLVLIMLAVLCSAAIAAPLTPHAEMRAIRDEASGAVNVELKVFDGTRQTAVYEKSVPEGIKKLEDFDTWYEELFALTYLSGDYGRLWKNLRSKTRKLTKDFMTREMAAALEGLKLLVVVEEQYPFPADTFRIGDRWLFEIVPIVHSPTGGVKDPADDYEYGSILVMDCQGPVDREGEEAPRVMGHLEKLPDVKSSMELTLENEIAAAKIQTPGYDVLHLATHAHPDEFFPGRGDAGITVGRLRGLDVPFRFILSTGCNTGNPLFAGAVLDEDTLFYVASMYKTAGKDGEILAGLFYPQLFAGASPFDVFYRVKQRITGKKSDMPDILRFAFYVR